MRVLAMDGHGDEDLYAVDLSGPIAFVFGNEAHGLPPEVIASADATVRVPHRGKAESLNLAAAATVCLFEWARRRHSGTAALETIVAAAAHDIRSPLTAMKGFGYALEKRWNVMTEEQRDADAAGDRARRRPDGRDPASAWSTRGAWRPAASRCSPSASTSRTSCTASATSDGARSRASRGPLGGTRRRSW